MKTDINSDGVLVIQPEGGVEDFALRQWYQMWMETKAQFALGYMGKDGIMQYKVVEP